MTTARNSWRSIPGYEGYYSISRTGAIRRDKGHKNTYAGRILAWCTQHDGYPYVELNKRGRAKKYTIHSLVALAYIGPVPEGEEVRHLDGNRANPRLSNLAYGTHKQNAQDMVEHGNSGKGEKHHGAVLTDSLVQEIRALWVMGYASGYIAGKYGIGRTTAWQAATGKRWKHIKEVK